MYGSASLHLGSAQSQGASTHSLEVVISATGAKCFSIQWALSSHISVHIHTDHRFWTLGSISGHLG